MKQCLRIKVFGKVQGVGYRAFVQKKCNSLDIEGTIQNIDSDCVLIDVCGASQKLDDLIEHLYKGTSKARVDNVEVEPLMLGKNFRGVFRIIGD